MFGMSFDANTYYADGYSYTDSITLVVENKKKSKTDNNMFSGLTNGKTTVKINVTYKNPGKSVSVTLPKDLSSYKLQKK